MEVGQGLFVIVPSYNEEQNIQNTFSEIRRILREAGIGHTVLFVDDGSRDGTWEKISALSQGVIGIRFSRNFGKEAAIYAGLERAYRENCGCAVVIDCDLQHPPEKIVEMYRLWENDYQLVECVKTGRGKERQLHRFGASLFYRFISRSVGMDMQNASDFKLLDRQVIEAVLEVREKAAFFRAVSSWVGFRSVQIPFQVAERQEGSSKWTTRSLIRYAVNNITAFSSFPLLLAGIFGGLSELAALVLLLLGRSIGMIVLFALNGIVMMALGIEGYYIAKIYDEVKNRPKYIISEVRKKDEKDI